jgi:hypothetical protein
MSVRTIPYLNTTALVGLNWEKSPRGLKDHALGVRWGSTFAPVADASLVGTPALLSLLMSGIPDKFKEQTLLVAYANKEEDVYFGALTSGAKPVLEPEQLFETQDALLSWLTRELTQDGVQGVVLSGQLDADIDTLLPIERIVPPPEDFEPAVLSGRARKFDISKAVAAAGNGQTATIGAVLALTLVGGFFLLTGESKQVAVVEPVKHTVYVSRDEATFLKSCARAFGTPWNVGPGWTLNSEGCAAPGMVGPNGVPVNSPIAYQVLSLRSGYDAAIARAASELVLGASNSQLQQNSDKLIITRAIETSEVRATVPVVRSTGAILPIFEGLYLGKARSIRMVGQNAEISLWGGFVEATDPLASLPWAEVKSLSRSDGLVTLVVGLKNVTPLEIIGEG